MTKFDKSGKIRLFGFVFWIIRVSQFQNRNMDIAKLEDLKIPVHLTHGKGLRSIKEPR
jgi:hypothetical protein